MAVKEIKDMAASVLERLRQQARRSEISYQSCLQLFAQEEFLRKLEHSRFRENLILKGGMFLYTLTEFEGRPTVDIDFMLRHLSNDLADMEKTIQEICDTDTGNAYITMEVVGTEEITHESEYPGVRIKLRAYIKNVRIPFSIDIGVDDVIIPGPVEREVITRLDGFEKPNILTYSLESTIAEKFDAVLKRMSATSRMKDFYDIYYLSEMFEFDGAVLKESIQNTLSHRGTVYDKDCFDQIRDFINNKYLNQLWNNYDPGAGIDKPEFSDAIDRLCAFLEPIFDTMIGQKAFDKSWNTENKNWE